MRPDEWQQIRTVLHTTLAHETAARTSPFDVNGSADHADGDELEPRDGAARHVESSGGDATAATTLLFGSVKGEASTPSGAGRIGPYQIVREIGRGGVGVVYLAARADDLFKQLVAIKVVKRGMDTQFVLRRFTRERQLLASLDHPNIARLLDGGVTAEGLPYFVMEYIEGLAVDEYCDEHKLSVDERLRLFGQICSAIQYAHQNLIIHRDIKPSNILVTSDGTPKLLDFGIAKLLKPELSAAESDLTAPAMRLMTPEYASPEQVRGLPVTTASDVYSLGILLYELLTGRPPYRLTRRTLGEFERVICEAEPERPSTAVSQIAETITSADDVDSSGHETKKRAAAPTSGSVATTRQTQPEKLRRRLSGDLDTIVLKALRKEPARRYASAEQLSEDIRRHLVGLPVVAQRDTFSYRGGKFIKRHKAGVAVSLLVTILLAAGVCATAWEARVARAERARAERRFQDVRQLANSFLFEFHDSIKDLPGSTKARELLVNRALEYLDGLSQEASGDASLQRELATAYMKVGDVQGDAYGSNLGDTAGALESQRKAQAILQRLVATHPADVQLRRDLAQNYGRVGTLLERMNKRDESLANEQEAVKIAEALVAADPNNTALRLDLLSIYSRYRYNLPTVKQWLEVDRKAQAVGEAMLATDAANPELRRKMHMIHLFIGTDLLMSAPVDEDLLENYRKGLSYIEPLVAANPLNTEDRNALATNYIAIGEAYRTRHKYPEALENYRKALTTAEALMKSDPLSAMFRANAAAYNLKYGQTLFMMGRTDEAIESYRKTITLHEALATADPARTTYRADMSYDLTTLGEALLKKGDRRAALQNYRAALALIEPIAANGSATRSLRLRLINTYEYVGDLLLKMGDAAAALENFNKALDGNNDLLSAEPTNTNCRYNVAWSYFLVGNAEAALAAREKSSAARRRERWREAREWYRKSLDIYQDLYSSYQLIKDYVREMNDIKRGLKKCDGALSKLRRAR